MLFVGSSCEDNIGIKVTDEAPNADKTLYDVIMNDNELTDFVEILNACNIPSEKRPDEIISVADSLFNTSRVYTLWAPINGSYNKDSVIERINAGFREDVMKTFVQSHVANFLKAAKGTYGENGEDGELILMLNEKKLEFAGSYEKGYTLDGKKLCSVNNRVKNGIIHKLSTVSEYQYNIWEYLLKSSLTSDTYEVDSMVNYLYSYNDTAFAKHLSIRGPIVNGVETYLDSVFEVNNKLLSRYNGGVGELNNEDSLYTFYLPTNELWNKMIELGENHFNYYNVAGSDKELIDSLRLYYPRHYMTKYLAYSQLEQRYVTSPDSAMPTQYEYPRKLFAKSSLDSCVVATKELSNGTLKIIDKFPYSIFDLWHDTIRVEAENQTLIDQSAGKSSLEFFKEYTVYEKDMNPILKEAGNKLSGNKYIKLHNPDSTGTASTDQVKIQYYIPNVKSATYKVGLVLVPENIVDSTFTDPNADKSAQLRIACNVLGYDPNAIKEDGSAPDEVQVLSSATIGTKDLPYDLTRIDTIFLPKPVKFPICEYNTGGDIKNTRAGIAIHTNNRSNNKHTHVIRLDAILLIPVEDAE